MKGFKILAVSLFAAMILASSCGGSKKTCPAYSKADTEQQEEINS